MNAVIPPMASAVQSNISKRPVTVGIVGGGVAGSTIAIKLSELGLKTIVFEKSDSLISGPPMCHLHAGGNLYREISDAQCIELLHQSVEIARLYPHTVDARPTVIAVPVRDKGAPEALLPRLDKLVDAYKQLVADDSANAVLGDPDDYYRVYNREQLQSLALRDVVAEPSHPDEWMIPVAKHLDFDRVQFPLIQVQEYGWNIFRLSASASIALGDLPHADVRTATVVTDVKPVKLNSIHTGWTIEYKGTQSGDCGQVQVDYLVNACGFRSGALDDMVGSLQERMVEFKASYVSHWLQQETPWPEVIFHGERGTPQGMAQLTPYGNGYFQIHGMTEDITLFKDGLVKNPDGSAQPVLNDVYLARIDEEWEANVVETRTQRAVEHVAYFLPAFGSATVAAKPLFGGQQIPGSDVDLRVADMSFSGQRYARCENVKASSALVAADALLDKLLDDGIIPAGCYPGRYFPMLNSVSLNQVNTAARATAVARQYPESMALINRPILAKRFSSESVPNDHECI